MDMWPNGTERNERGELVIGGVPVTDLVKQYGSPLYVYDEATLRANMRAWRTAFDGLLDDVRVAYAGKAFLTTAIATIVGEEGLYLDCVSAGEMFVGLNAGIPAKRISLHGNNKGPSELEMALEAGIGKIIIDNFNEIELLAELTAGREAPMTVMLRLNPGVDVHTHRKISTGVADSKFGLLIAGGDAARAVARIAEIPGLDLVGYHCHVGSQIFTPDAHVAAINEIMAFAADMMAAYGIEPNLFSPGGGFGIRYGEGDQPMPAQDWAASLAETISSACQAHNLPLPTVIIEPGRSIVGPAGVAIYTVGAAKHIPGVRTYISVDGGMADNIRPALYEAVYHAEIANRSGDGDLQTYTIAGKYCESGDLLIEQIDLPSPQEGDLLALAAAGAYCLAMASNYNMSLKPAVVLVQNGSSRVIRRRESFADLIRLDA